MKAVAQYGMSRLRQLAALGGPCPRATVVCSLYDRDGVELATTSNARYDGSCDCNTDPVDTKAAASSSCLAVHAEVAALLAVAKAGQFDRTHAAVVTRAPCRACLAALLASPVQELFVSSEWPDRESTESKWKAQGRQWHWVQ